MNGLPSELQKFMKASITKGLREDYGIVMLVLTLNNGFGGML